MKQIFKIEAAGQAADIEHLEGARTLLVGENAATLPAFTGQANSNYLVDLRLRRHGSVLRRVFALEPFRTVELSCEAYDSAYVGWTAVGAGGALPPLQVTLSVQPPNPAREELVWLPATYAPGVWVTPPGARALRTATADAGFLWRGYGPAGIDIPTPLLVGASVPAYGPLFVPSVSLSVIWEIAL